MEGKNYNTKGEERERKEEELWLLAWQGLDGGMKDILWWWLVVERRGNREREKSLLCENMLLTALRTTYRTTCNEGGVMDMDTCNEREREGWKIFLLPPCMQHATAETRGVRLKAIICVVSG